MKKVTLLLFASLLIVPMLSQIRSAYATSCGYERYKDDICEVYVEYFPIVPYDPAYPTASEDFAIKFSISQTHWWEGIPLDPYHFIPQAWGVYVYYRDDCCYSDYVMWKKWYPTSTSQTGWQVSWSLEAGYQYFSVGATISAPSAEEFETNYTKYYKDGYLHVGTLTELFTYDCFRGDTYTEGAGSLGVPNDQAQSHEGHHVTLWVHFRLLWLGYSLGIVPIGPVEVRDIDFIIGDDIPADTDCWLNVEQGDTAFSVNSGSSGGGDNAGCPTLFAWNGNGYVDYGVINIHNPTGEDIVREVPVRVEDVGINNHRAKFRLREGWEGLNFSESVIDQVKLYAVDNYGNRYLCPLISANHSRFGNVLPQLLASDDYRVQMLLLETVDLTFVVPWQNIQGFTFAIEGCNYFKY